LKRKNILPRQAIDEKGTSIGQWLEKLSKARKQALDFIHTISNCTKEATKQNIGLNFLSTQESALNNNTSLFFQDVQK